MKKLQDRSARSGRTCQRRRLPHETQAHPPADASKRWIGCVRSRAARTADALPAVASCSSCRTAARRPLSSRADGQHVAAGRRGGGGGRRSASRARRGAPRTSAVEKKRPDRPGAGLVTLTGVLEADDEAGDEEDGTLGNDPRSPPARAQDARSRRRRRGGEGEAPPGAEAAACWRGPSLVLLTICALWSGGDGRRRRRGFAEGASDVVGEGEGSTTVKTSPSGQGGGAAGRSQARVRVGVPRPSMALERGPCQIGPATRRAMLHGEPGDGPAERPPAPGNPPALLPAVLRARLRRSGPSSRRGARCAQQRGWSVSRTGSFEGAWRARPAAARGSATFVKRVENTVSALRGGGPVVASGGSRSAWVRREAARAADNGGRPNMHRRVEERRPDAARPEKARRPFLRRRGDTQRPAP